ncbi:MAG TPA: DUF418 domain-containing protein [Pseudonocardiaceae bacterium]|nr:DUF418 domain-containing protein [Pseudonocardiaceae bacterium]
MLIQARDPTLLIVAALGTVPIVVFHTMGSRVAHSSADSKFTGDVLRAAGLRVLEWVHGSLIGAVFLLVPAVLLGAWAARQRLLNEPGRHRRSLLRVAVLGVGLAIVGGLPWALLRASWAAPPSAAAAELVSVVHTLTGYGGGVGYAAIAGLVAVRVQRRHGPGPVLRALSACGQRSLTCYLLQSVVFVAVLAAYGGGFGNRVGIVEIALLATGTWVVTVLLAELMARRGYRGPAEVLLRRLTYGPDSRRSTRLVSAPCPPR